MKIKERKNTLKKATNKYVNIKITEDPLGCWEHYISKEKIPYKITGKYLFFSVNRNVLKKIATTEIKNHNFHHAKIKTEEAIEGDDFVLCLYYSDDSRKFELSERYKSCAGVRYRYWKSDLDTKIGKYSAVYNADRLLNPKRKKVKDIDKYKALTIEEGLRRNLEGEIVGNKFYVLEKGSLKKQKIK
ncbi:MAG: hypothetical protein Q8O74_04530 [bacterium]|nr:hypothetical protein [bacterium]